MTPTAETLPCIVLLFPVQPFLHEYAAEKPMKKLLYMVFAFFCISSFLPAQEQERPPLKLDLDLRLFGADIALGYRGYSFVPGLDTIFWVSAGGGYENRSFYHYLDDTLYNGDDPAVDPLRDPFYWRLNGSWFLGLAQGIVWNERIDENFLEAFLLYRGRIESFTKDPLVPNQLVFRSSLPDREGTFQNAILCGLSLNDVSFNKTTKTYTGIYGEASAEYSPASFNISTYGNTDFFRLNGTVKFFFPLYESTYGDGLNLLSIYLCDYLSADYLMGDSIPINARETFGGRDTRDGLGSAVRGLDKRRFDSTLKAVNNFEIRMNLPALGIRDITSGMLLYFDTGFYGGMKQQAPGFVFATGGGIFLNFFDFAVIVVYAEFLLNDTTVAGGSITFPQIEFGLHF